MHQVLLVESHAHGVLMINGQFCGPLETDGQAFPLGRNTEAYIQLFPFDPSVPALTARMEIRAGVISRLEPIQYCYALVWPSGIIQLELRPQRELQTAQEQALVSGVLARYLVMRLAGDVRASAYFMREQDEPEHLQEYHAVVPLRFAPENTPDRCDDRAGLVRRTAPNVAVVDAALAATVPSGAGRRKIERVDIIRTGRLQADEKAE